MIAVARTATCGPWSRAGLQLLCALVWWLPVVAQSEVTEEPRAPVVASSPGIIARIEFTGNRVTKPQIMLQEMLVKEGDVADPTRIEQSRQAIMDLGLFTSVRATVVPQEEGSVLRIAVKEKIYILPVPKLNRDDKDNFSLGAEISLDNFAGLNQQLKVEYESNDAGLQSPGQIDTYSLSYNYPRVFGGPYLFHTDIRQQRMPVEEIISLPPGPVPSPPPSLYEKEAWTVNLLLSRWVTQDGPSRGWQVGAGLVWRRNAYDYVSGPLTSTFQDAQAVGLSAIGQYVNVRNYLYSREGMEFGYIGEFGAPVLGSDTEYKRHELFYRKYVLLAGREHENIDFQARLGLSSGDIFPDDIYAYSIGGSRTLRGYESGSYTGNAFVLFNVQYLRPLFGHFPLRGVLSLDVGNAYPSNEQIDLGDLKWSAGVGLRWRLKSFVKIDLRVDVSYAYDTGETKVFAGTKEIF